MKKEMNLTLTRPSNSTVESIIQFINELIDCLRVENKSKNVIVDDRTKRTLLSGVSACFKLRNDRMAFEKNVNNFLKDFDNISEKKQADVEMHFYNAIKKLESLVPVIKAEIKEHKFSIVCRFHDRELKQTLKFFKSSQKTISEHLYPDNSQQILSNPVEYQKLVDFWGDLAD